MRYTPWLKHQMGQRIYHDNKPPGPPPRLFDDISGMQYVFDRKEDHALLYDEAGLERDGLMRGSEIFAMTHRGEQLRLALWNRIKARYPPPNKYEDPAWPAALEMLINRFCGIQERCNEMYAADQEKEQQRREEKRAQQDEQLKFVERFIERTSTGMPSKVAGAALASEVIGYIASCAPDQEPTDDSPLIATSGEIMFGFLIVINILLCFVPSWDAHPFVLILIRLALFGFLMIKRVKPNPNLMAADTVK